MGGRMIIGCVSALAFAAGVGASVAFLAPRQPTAAAPTGPDRSSAARRSLPSPAGPEAPLIVDGAGQGHARRPTRIIRPDEAPEQSGAPAPTTDQPVPEPQTPDEIARAFDRVKLPPSGLNSPPNYDQLFREAMESMASLALRLHEADPSHPRVPFVMRRRWEVLTNALGRAPQAYAEAGRFARTSTGELAKEAAFARARAAVVMGTHPRDELATLIDQAIDAIGKNARTGDLLIELATVYTAEPDDQRALAKRAEDGFGIATSGFGKQPRDALRLAELAGKSLSLSFHDALSGREFSLESHLGHPVVIVNFPSMVRPPEGFDIAAVLSTLRQWSARGVRVVLVHERPSPEELDLIRSLGQDDAIAHLIQEGSPWETFFYKDCRLNACPAWVLINRKGKVECATEGLLAISPFVERLLRP